MDALADLYQQLIMDHNARPRNFGPLPEATHAADGHNPLCGDQVHVAVQLQDGTLTDVRFEGQGCAISKASASLMTDRLRGLSREDAEAVFDAFHTLVAGSDEKQAALDDALLGKLLAFSGVRGYPMRVKCATLAWHTLHTALKTPAATAAQVPHVTTE